MFAYSIMSILFEFIWVFMMFAYEIFVAFTGAYFMFAYSIMSILFAFTWGFRMFICCIYIGILDVCLQYILCIYGGILDVCLWILHLHGIQDICLFNILRRYRGMLDVYLEYIHGIYTIAFYRFAYSIMSRFLHLNVFSGCLRMKYSLHLLRDSTSLPPKHSFHLCRCSRCLHVKYYFRWCLHIEHSFALHEFLDVYQWHLQYTSRGILHFC